MPSSSLQKARLVVENARVDVLVYSEIGMNSMAYFLLFSRLARRTAIFWGHAVTSGVSQFDTEADEGTGGGDYYISSNNKFITNQHSRNVSHILRYNFDSILVSSNS